MSTLGNRQLIAGIGARTLRALCSAALIFISASSSAAQAEAQRGHAGHAAPMASHAPPSGPAPEAGTQAGAMAAGMHGMGVASPSSDAKRANAESDAQPASEAAPMSAMGHQEQSGSEHDRPAQGHDMATMPAAASIDRDPHAYSDGFTLDAGPYAGSTRLHLADEKAFSAVLLDRVEVQRVDGEDPTVYDVQAWYGTTYDRLWAKLEGDTVDGRIESTQNELFYSRAVTRFWDLQAGVRLDTYDDANDATWLAFGLQGLAPYWFEVDATAYVGDGGATALSVEAEYDLFLTQRLILQPRVEVNAYGSSDRDRGLGRGLSDAEAGVRLRYEFDRRFAPYVGIQWSRQFGNAAEFAKAAGNPTSDAMVIAGLRMWF